MFKTATNVTLNHITPQLYFSLATFSRKYKQYSSTKYLPPIEDKGHSIRQPAFIGDSKSSMLDKDIDNTLGLSEKRNMLTDNMV